MLQRRGVLTAWHLLMFCFAAGIVLGTAAVNAAGETGLASESGEAFLTAVRSAADSAEGNALGAACLVGARRLLETGFLWALGLTGFSVPGFAAVSLYLGVSSSVMLSSFTLEYGLRGLPLYAASLFPQVFFYLPVFFLLAFWGLSREKRLHKPALLLLLAVTAAGAGLESYINPRILELFL